MLLTSMLFKSLVHVAALHGFVKVHQMTVKVRAIHTGKLGFSAHGQATAAAHAGAINHDGVHGNHGFNVVLFGGQGHKFHHNQRADGDYLVILLALFNQLFQGGGYNAFLLKFGGDAPESADLAEIRRYGMGVLNVTVAELGAAYELLEWQRYKEILDNIIYLGLPRAAREILAKTGGKEGPDAAQL